MKVRVYLDHGVGPFSFKQTIQELHAELGSSVTIHSINHRQFLEEDWEIETSLLVFPGGRDVPYHIYLQGSANERIRNYVRQGGTYLGFCAGAYYGCAFVEFDKGYPLEVCGARELAFFPGKAVGPAYGGNTFCYESEKGSKAARIQWFGAGHKNEYFSLYYNGGCYFEEAEKHSNIKILGRYADLEESPAAIIECQLEKGKAILCGVHPEYGASILNPFNPYSRKILFDLQSNEERRQLFWRQLLKHAVA